MKIIPSPMMTRLLIFLGAVIAIIGFLATEFDYPFPWNYPIRGLDISHHQGSIDWGKLGKAKVDFVYIKATEGVDYTDHLFASNWQGAQRADIKRGAYHFFSLCKPGIDQARNFIKTVKLSKGDLPPAIDLEFGGNCTKIPSRTQLVAELQAFEKEIYTAYAVRPIYYVTEDFFEHYFKGQEPSNALWIRGIYHKPKFMKNAKCKFWQYSSIGYVNGIHGRVDLNVFNGNRLEFGLATGSGLQFGNP
jgi:lysozyme